MELDNVQPSEITFKQQLSCSSASAIFLVEIQGTTCVMKVHHGQGPKQYYETRRRETNLHICEKTAYKRLKESGLCDRGIVPKFYGIIENIDPKDEHYQPHLEMFLEDEYPPNAVLLEYIPNMQELHFSNYTPERMGNFIKGIKDIIESLPSTVMCIQGI